MLCKLFKEPDNKTYVLVFFLNVDTTFSKPLVKVEVVPKNEKDLWVFENFAGDLLTTDTK